MFPMAKKLQKNKGLMKKAVIFSRANFYFFIPYHDTGTLFFL